MHTSSAADASAVGQLWLPGMEGPHDDFVARVHRSIERFAAEHGIEKAVVELELRDGSRYTLERLSPEPGYGFVTITPVAGGDAPGELIVPLGAIGRIEFSATPDQPERFGFSVPQGESSR
jgi:hypothetical protein